MLNKKFGYKLLFLIQILILPFAFHVLAFEDSASTDILPTSSAVSIPDLTENLEVNLVTLVIEENMIANADILSASTATSSIELNNNSDVENVDALTTEKNIKKDVENEQTEWIKSNDKYKQIKKEDTNGEYEVHEYETPDGEKGYQILFYDEFGNIIESKGYGVEAESRTWAQVLPVFTDPSIATSTTAL